MLYNGSMTLPVKEFHLLAQKGCVCPRMTWLDVERASSQSPELRITIIHVDINLSSIQWVRDALGISPLGIKQFSFH